MTRTVRASRSVLTARSVSSPESIWISDSLLAQSFYRFVHIQTRHGSNVPGPLESRRRTNKRRNTNFAQTSPGPSIDPDLLFETGPHHAWWQTSSTPPSTPAESSVSHFLPSWLAPSLHPPLPNNWPVSKAPISKPKVEQPSPSSSETFQVQLSSARSLDQVKAVIKRLGLNLAEDPVYSELAFNHILTSNYALASEFLLDPRLNPPTARNYSRVVSLLKEKVASDAERKTLLNALFKGFSVGLVRREEAQSIVQTLPDIMVNSKDGPVRARQTPKVARYYGVILKCLVDCNVFSTRNLGVDSIKAWIHHASEILFDRHVAELILSLTKSAALLQARARFEPGSRAFEVVMAHTETTATCDLITRWVKILCECPARRKRDVGHLAQFLCRRPPALLRSVLVRIPKRLVVSIRDDSLSSEALVIWEQVLRSLDQDTIAPVLRKDSLWTKKMSEIDAGLSADARLLLRLWTVLVLCDRAEEPSHVFQQMDFLAQLREQYKECDPALLCNHISRTLQSLPKLHFKGQLFDFLAKFPQQRRSSTDVVRTTKQQAVLDHFAGRGFAVLQDDEAYRQALRQLNDPLKELVESVNSDITSLARIVLPLVAQDKLSLRIVTRLLKHNEKFHFALMQSWSPPPALDTNAASPGGASASVSQLTQPPMLPMTSDDSKFSEMALQFVHNLAIACALSPALSDRQALRKVVWCFNFLHRYGAPIHSPLTKALWYAAVTRCKGKGTARTVLLWVLRKIREVESAATAEQLVTNPEFRAKRALEMCHWGRLLGQGHDTEDEKPGRCRGLDSKASWACRLHPSAPRRCSVT